MSDPSPRARLSAVVVTYNRAAIIATTLRALAFADEIIVVDKSSSDATPAIAAQYADRVVTVPWSPTVEADRALAIARCSHDWVLCLDDDECLNADAVLFIDAELRNPRADIYYIPLRHYVLGVHDPRAYYWPEAHPRLFRKSAVDASSTVHGGFRPISGNTFSIDLGSGACIHHLSHVDSAQWIEKTNRYTSVVDRIGDTEGSPDLFEYAHAQIDLWKSKSDAPEDPYVAAVAMLRAVYGIVDRIKAWEQARPSAGAALFAQACAALDAEYATRLSHLARPHPVT